MIDFFFFHPQRLSRYWTQHTKFSVGRLLSFLHATETPKEKKRRERGERNFCRSCKYFLFSSEGTASYVFLTMEKLQNERKSKECHMNFELFTHFTSLSLPAVNRTFSHMKTLKNFHTPHIRLALQLLRHWTENLTSFWSQQLDDVVRLRRKCCCERTEENARWEEKIHFRRVQASNHPHSLLLSIRSRAYQYLCRFYVLGSSKKKVVE